MSKSSVLPRPRFTFEHFELDNGLRVVLNPDHSAPAVGIGVCYDVGFRSEPEGRTGFAHLFEHLMFQGSATLDKGEADRLIEGNGGVMNGSTHPDYTDYVSMLPSNALELGLFLEADRMRGIRLTEENLQNQIDVVKEEIRVNVLNRPYGGFPWIDLPPVVYKTFNNAHNGYGSFVDLESATIDDAADFFKKYYSPSNAVLSVAGDLDVDKTGALIERHFRDLPRRRRPKQQHYGEPVPSKEERAVKQDPLAPMTAVAIGYRVPDPIAQIQEYLAAVVLGQILGGSEASRLYQRLVKRDRIAAHVTTMMGAFGDPLDERDPLLFQVIAYLSPGSTLDQLLSGVDAEIESVGGGVRPEEITRAQTTLVSGILRHVDQVLERAVTAGVAHLYRGSPDIVNNLPVWLGDVTAGAIAGVARTWLKPTQRGVLEVVPAPGQAAR